MEGGEVVVMSRVRIGGRKEEHDEGERNGRRGRRRRLTTDGGVAPDRDSAINEYRDIQTYIRYMRGNRIQCTEEK